ncbi:MAG: hypothetical protein ACFHHU_00145 [Porticoccaceae bacterium]
METGGNIRVFAYFTSGDRFFALHGNSGAPLTTITEVTHLSKSVNRGDAKLRRSRFECAIRQRESEGYIHVGYRKLMEDGSLGEKHLEDKHTLPRLSVDALPETFREGLSDLLSQEMPKPAITVAISGKTAGMVRMALLEAKTALEGQGMNAEIGNDFEVKLAGSFEGQLKSLFAANDENMELSMSISDQELKRSEFLPLLFWAIAQKMLSKDHCSIADAEGRIINNCVEWIFKTFGFNPNVEQLAVQLGLQMDLSQISVQSAGF